MGRMSSSLGIGLGLAMSPLQAGGEVSLSTQYAKWLLDLEPVAFFRMADAGTTMVDEIGTITTGVHSAAALQAPLLDTSTGVHNYTGSTDSTFTTAAALRTPSFTAAVWCYIPSSAPESGMSVINAFNGEWTHGYQMWISNSRQPLFYRGNGEGYANVQVAGVVSLETPLRFVITHDAVSGLSKGYVNAVTTVPDGVAYAYLPPTSNGTWEIGSEDGSNRLTGQIWDVALYDYAWDLDTVEEDYERGLAGSIDAS